QFQFRFEKVFPQTLDAGNLNARYDVLVFVEGGIPSDRAQGAAQPSAADIPAEFRPWLGRGTSEKTLPQIRTFIENGGTVITIGDSSTNLARFLNLPIENHLAEGGQPLPDAKFYAPGSVLTAKVNVTHPIAHGMKERTDVFFDNIPVFKLGPGAATQGLGVGPALSRERGRRDRGDGRQGTRVAVRPRDSEARPATRNVQVP